jgi:hypothetical protein
MPPYSTRSGKKDCRDSSAILRHVLAIMLR